MLFFPPLLVCFFKKNIYLFIYLAAAGLSCGMRDLRCGVRDLQLQHVGSFSCSMWDLDRTQAPCIGSAESQPLDHQGSPLLVCFLITYEIVAQRFSSSLVYSTNIS